MSTTPLPPLPVTEHNHPEHAWRWTPTEIRWMDARDAQWQAYATAARADLEAENARLREALNDIAEYTGEGPLSTPWRDIVKACGEKARAALENRA